MFIKWQSQVKENQSAIETGQNVSPELTLTSQELQGKMMEKCHIVEELCENCLQTESSPMLSMAGLILEGLERLKVAMAETMRSLPNQIECESSVERETNTHIMRSEEAFSASSENIRRAESPFIEEIGKSSALQDHRSHNSDGPVVNISSAFDEFDESTFVHINADEIRECEEAFAQGGVASCESFLRRKAEEWRTIPLNIGIIGNSGTGKSSFINAIRGRLTADEEGAAEVTIPTPYAHPNNSLLKFWVLPGVKTPNFPKETYLEKIGFQKFDFFLIMSRDRFTDNDLWIAREIAGKEKQFFFIRSHIHGSIANHKMAHPRTHNPEAVLESIREDIKQKLGDMYRENGAFLIDNHKRNLYDFDLLEQRIIEDLPSLKRAAFILSVSTLSEDMVKKKVEVLRGEIWKTTLLSGTIAIVPIPGLSLLVDIGMIVDRNKFYFKQLGLDEESLKQTARIMCCDVGQLTQIVEKSRQEFLTWQGVRSCIQGISIGEAAAALALFVPFLGSLRAGGISAVTTYKILNHVLTKMEQTALLVVRAAVEVARKLINDAESDSE